MSKKLQLQIPVPCHENWEQMTDVEKGRFCFSCQKTVIDFTNLSDREIAVFFKKSSTGSVCGRFLQDQLNRDIVIPRKRIPLIKYFFQFMLPAFLLSMKATAQRQAKAIRKTIIASTCTLTQGDAEFNYIDTMRTNSRIEVLGNIAHGMSRQSETRTIRGNVVDENGSPVPFASIMVKGTTHGVVADSTGRFELDLEEYPGSIRLVVSSVGFLPFEKEFSNAEASAVTLLLKANASLGEVLVTSIAEYRKGMVCGSVTEVVSSGKTPSTFPGSYLKIYPNPARSNSTLHIVCGQKGYGEYLLKLFNQSGQLVFIKELYIAEGASLVSVDLPFLPAGNYFLRMSDKQSAKSYSEKIIIQ